MTAEEKARVYTLIQTASAWSSGYVAKDFATPPEFHDDEVAEPPEAAQAVTQEMPAVRVDDDISSPVQQGVTLETLSRRIVGCRNCILCQKRTNTVPGEGVMHPFVMVIGEGPGEDEDRTGRPFVGKAGQLLDKMLSSISLGRDSNCFIANIVKCRPPLNRAPMSDEAAACIGYLNAQIHILKPRFILALGRTAAQNLLKTDKGINALRGQFFDLDGIPLIATYHPSALLRDESLKRPAWEDLKTLRARLQNDFPDYASAFFRNQNKA